jgi:hypothetical protein
MYQYYYTFLRNSSVGIATRLWYGRPRNQGSITSTGKGFSHLHSVKTASASYPKVPGVKLTINLHQMLKLKMHEAMPPQLFHGVVLNYTKANFMIS